jgi:hypothetical protein
VIFAWCRDTPASSMRIAASPDRPSTCSPAASATSRSPTIRRYRATAKLSSCVAIRSTAASPKKASVHDDITRDNFLSVGGGVAYAMREKIDVFGSVVHALAAAQRNGHQIQSGVTVGLSWSFSTKRANDRAIASAEKALARCVCEKGTK